MSVPAAALVVVVVIELVEAGVVLVLVVDEELGTLEDEAAFGSSMVNIDEDICSEVELGVSPLGTNRNTQVREAERSLVGIEAVHVTDSEVDTSKLEAILYSCASLLPELVTQRSTEDVLQSGQYWLNHPARLGVH